MNRLAPTLAAVCAAAIASAVESPRPVDIVQQQILLDVKFLTASGNDLKDLGVDWGWGLGLSWDLPVSLGNATPFIKAEYQRQDGDNDLKSESTGIAAGVKLSLVPKVQPNGTDIRLYLSIGAYETKASDVLFSEKKSGAGYDAGIQVKLPGLTNIPVLSVLFTSRPKTFDRSTNNIVIMISPTLIKLGL